MESYKLTEINNCKIFIAPCPRGGGLLEDDIRELSDLNISLLISLLTFTESAQLELSAEADVCRSYSVDFINFPIMDKGICGFDNFVEFIELIYHKTQEMNSILIHCQHGVGRSGMIALGLMVKSGKDLEESIKLVSKNRGYTIPQSISQRKLLSAYYKSLL
ncbi:protein-tyrosine phosphatase family protein [Aequorivita ciconiae]|uniref:protein-tyrosine phosphatase family protein n=1 Tax=Aequorivita ciconiae TaxID=2494375 RepID=UPI0013E3BE4C|nr:protein-tyrosine phosphatase family protein [Aequorivita sp. H23M31]